jgi:ubiquitin-large subunit ribosomal protein L40e
MKRYIILTALLLGITGGLQSAAAPSLEFWLKFLSGKTVSVTVPEDAIVRNLKEKIFEKEGIPVERQNIMEAGRALNDNEKVNTIAPVNRGKLHIVLKIDPIERAKGRVENAERHVEETRKAYEAAQRYLKTTQEELAQLQQKP